jgi:hypothetical protein
MLVHSSSSYIQVFPRGHLFYAVGNKYTYVPTTVVAALLLLLVQYIPLLVVVLPKPGKSSGIVNNRGAILSKYVGDTSEF